MKMKAYKGFDKDLKCRGYQYEVGKDYETDSAKCCHKGFHACENPLDVLRYYSPADSRYCIVELNGDIDKSKDDSKVASTKITLVSEIGLNELIDAGIEFTISHAKDNIINTGDCSASTNTGDYSVSTNTGNYSASTNTGDYSASTVTGIGSVALVTGFDSKAKASIGSAIVICERGDWNGKERPLIGIKSALVDGKELKADTFYTLKNGKFVEVS